MRLSCFILFLKIDESTNLNKNLFKILLFTNFGFQSYFMIYIVYMLHSEACSNLKP